MDISALFQCRSIAVIGASRDQKKIGHHILKSLQKNSNLELFPINPHASTLLGLRTFASLKELPHPVDVAIIAVPFAAVESIVDECIQTHVKAVIIITSGFAENGKDGKEVQDRITQKLSQANILLLGPNTMGYIAPFDNIYASFGADDVTPGPIAVISQSGAMLSALFQAYASAKTGVSFAVSLGNRAGIDELSLLEHAAKDHHTRVIVLYMESFRNIPVLLSLASRIVKSKPIFLLKGGTTERGISAAVSHTAALATSQALLRDAAQQAGIVIVETFEQLVRASIASAKSAFLPEHLMVVTNAGGPSVVLVDEAVQAEVPLASLSAKTASMLAEQFPTLRPTNPLDLLGDATPEMFDLALNILSHDLTIDALACIVTQQSITDMDGITKVLMKPRGKRLVIACLTGGDQLEPYREKLRHAGVVVTEYPNEVVETMKALVQAQRNMEKTLPYAVLSLSSSAQPTKTTHTYPETFSDLQTVLESYGLRFPKQVLISDEKDFSELETLSFPLVAKTTDLALKHKAKLGAVIADIHDLGYARVAYNHLKQWNAPVVFQETITNAHEALVGMIRDPQFGWYCAVGLGGSLSDTLADRKYVFLPAQKTVIAYTLSQTKLASLLTKEQTHALVETINTLQHCALETNKLTELEINPLFITENNTIVADMKRG